MKAPIAILSFNRPGFLAATLASLKAQAGNALAGREIHLFQDGAVNLYSKITYARASDITDCVALFRSHFPAGEVHLHGGNVGICENFYRAENYLFSERQFPVAWFFEDDLVLSPVYFQMMEVLQGFAERSPRVAYFSAYGDHYATADELAERRREIVGLDHHWAFGLRREHWAKLRAALDGYYRIVRGGDYARRDHRAIFEYFAAQGDTVPRGSSQDAAKAWACDRLGFWRCRTFVPFGRYIGTQGAHMTPEVYQAMGFGRTVVADRVIENLDFPDEAAITTRLAEQHALFMSVKSRELEQLVANLPARKLNPMRLCTEDDVRSAYQLLLHRAPESRAVIDGHVQKTTVFSLIREISRSKEFTDLSQRIDTA